MSLNSLLARLMLVVSIALVPALGFQAYTESEARHARQQLVEDEAMRLMHLVSTEQQRITESAEQVLSLVGTSPAIQDSRWDLCQRLLAGLLEQSPRYVFAAFVGLDGHTICAPHAVDRGIDASNRAYFRLALQTGGFAIGTYVVGDVTGQPSLHMAEPVRGQDGTIIGVVAVALSLDWLGQQLGNLALPPGTVVSILDRNGTFLARRPGGERYTGQRMRPEHRYLLEGNTDKVVTMTSLEGRPLVTAYSPLDSDPKGWVVTVGLDRDLAFADVGKANRAGMLLIIAGAGLALAITYLAGTQLIRRPLDRLFSLADRWRIGDLAARTELPADSSDFGRLGAAFDGMAAALDARERALRSALESTTDGVVALDRAWRFTYLNQHAKDLISRGQDLLGQVVWDVFPGLAGTAFGNAYRAAMDNGEPTQAEGYYGPLDGHFKASIYPSREGVTVFYHDLTPEYRIATALAGSETKLRLAQEAAGIGIWEFNGATRDILWSPEQFRLHGLDPASGAPAFGQWLERVDPEDRPAILIALANAQSTGTVLRLEFRIRRASDGAVRWLAALARRVTNGADEASRLVGVSIDVTERRQAEDDVRRATALLSAVGDCSPDAIYAKDSDGRFLFANPAFLAILGKAADEVIGRTDAEWHHDPQQAEAVMANDRRIIETGRAEVLEEVFDAAGLGRRVFRSAKAPLRLKDGTAVGVVAVSSDITRIKTTEAELRRLTETLETRVRDEVAAREAAQARAAHAERMQALGQLAGGIAHDFNNVLQGVEGAAALIERRPGDEARVRRLARLAMESVERGASITRRLLAFGRRSDLRAEAVDVHALLGGLHEILGHTLGAAIAVQVKIEANVPPILADKGQLETALVNLATNARDAMPNGGRLTLLAENEVAPDCLAGLAPGRYVRLSVADTGAGMDAGTLARAAEPFFTTKGPGAGTGLGLPMAKGFAEQSGGALRVESIPGNGTTISLWLPVAAGSRIAIGEVQSPADAAITSDRPAALARVLLVDDEAVIREVLTEQFEAAGFSVVAASSGEEALSLLAAGTAVDTLVTDLSMPGIDGLTVIRAAQERYPGLPAVLLTGNAGDGVALAVGGAVSGSFSLLRKPVSGEYLIDRVRAGLSARARPCSSPPPVAD